MSEMAAAKSQQFVINAVKTIMLVRLSRPEASGAATNGSLRTAAPSVYSNQRKRETTPDADRIAGKPERADATPDTIAACEQNQAA